jgi:hypothetical protein
MELVMQVAAKPVHVTYDPTRRAVGPGSDPYSGGMLLAIGKMVPPLRAVTEGVKGASTRSARVTA